MSEAYNPIEAESSGIDKRKIIVGLVAVILIVLVAILLLGRKKTQPTVPAPIGSAASPTIVQQSELTGKKKYGDITKAKSILDWLDKAKDDREIYYVHYICDKDGQCQTPQVGNQTGIEPMWGRFMYYQQTKDSKELDVIKKDIANYSDEKKISTIQNSAWNCKLMYDLWKSNAFTADEKKKIEFICFSSTYFPVTFSDSDPLINDINLENIMKGKNPGSLVLANKDNLDLYATAASDYIAQYFWKSQNAYITLSKVYFYYALSSYSQLSDSQGANVSYLAIASYDIYKATHEEQYLKFAEYLFDQQVQKPCSTVKQCVGAIMLSNSLMEETKKAVFLDGRNNALIYLMDNGYDSKLQAVHEIVTGDTKMYYQVQMNGLVAGLLSEK